MTDGFSERTTEQIVDLNPLDRFAQPEEIADAVMFLA
jgi:3-oxoacyl-[acyl-carrier protein] reductase